MADKPKAPSAAAPPREAGDAPDGEGPSGGIDFITFVLSLAASTMIHLGEQEDGTPGPVQLPLAKQSIDPGSKDNGGELNWASPAGYVKPFSEAMIKLKKGEYTKAPVKTDFGYHVIQLDDSRPLNPPPFEQVKPQLLQRANAQMVEELVKDLRAKAKVN